MCTESGGNIWPPQPNLLEPSFGVISPVMDLYGWQKHSGKADQSTLASGGSEHA